MGFISSIKAPKSKTNTSHVAYRKSHTFYCVRFKAVRLRISIQTKLYLLCNVYKLCPVFSPFIKLCNVIDFACFYAGYSKLEP